MTVKVRRALRADARTIADFAIALFEMHASWNAKRFTQIATEEGAERFYGDRAEAGFVLVAEIERELVGFAFFEYEAMLYAELATNVVVLHDLYVAREARGRGAGRELLNALHAEAKRLRADKILLSVAAANAEGRTVFERNGYETTMHEMMLVVDGGD
jgi:GNAT superfamily N-acetyltransferase